MSAIVTNCHPTLAFECPREWNRLQPTGRDNVRYCHTCSRQVFLCAAPEEAERYAEVGQYVAEEPADFCQPACA